jgi:putative toxin-antitoxin system antitoxin component (TIGR02293 family)
MSKKVYSNNPTSPDMVTEPYVLYGAVTDLGSYIRQIAANTFNKHSLHSLSGKGLDAKVVLSFTKAIHVSLESFVSFLDITRKTLDRKIAANQPLSRSTTEHVLSIFRIYHLGIQTFGSVEEFNQWLASPNVALGGVLPKTYLSSITGISLLEDTLLAIAHGDVA